MEERFPHLRSQEEIDEQSRPAPVWLPVLLGFAFGLWGCGIVWISVELLR